MTDINPSLDPTSNRSEIVFLFDATDANPNGDPLTEENRPRVDDANQQALVTDVRLKRTIRDYLDTQGYPIFIKAAGEEEDRRDDKNDRFEAIEPLMEEYLEGDMDEHDDEKLEQAFLAVATDVRLFGDSMAFDTAQSTDYLTTSYTGPIQFGFARSLNKVEVSHHGKTSVLSASSEDQENIGGNMYTEHRLPYALFSSHAIINEHSAEDTYLSNEDIDLTKEALWQGTHQLNSSSKMGLEPRLLIHVTYTEDASHIGDLHRDVSLTMDSDKSVDIRDIEEAVIEVDNLLAALQKNRSEIKSIEGRLSRRVRVEIDGEESGPDGFVTVLKQRLDSTEIDLSTE